MSRRLKSENPNRGSEKTTPNNRGEQYYLDYGGPWDYHRYTVAHTFALFKCSGFEVKEIYGEGDRLSVLWVILGISKERLNVKDREVVCDGLLENLCGGHAHHSVFALGVKVKSVEDAATVTECMSEISSPRDAGK